MRIRWLLEDALICSMIGGGFILATAALIGAIVLPVRQISHHVDISVCRTFSSASGYQTRFVEYNWMNWECLAKASNGHWVNKDQLHDVNVEPKR